MNSTRRGMTRKQENALNALVCERLCKQKKYAKLISTFVQPHSRNLDVVSHAKKFGVSDDKASREAYYLVRTRTGVGLFFFTLEAGELFCPFRELLSKGGQEAVVTLAKKIKAMISSAVDDRVLKEEIRTLLEQKVSADEFIDEIEKKYSLTEDNKAKLEAEREDEHNKLISRVHSTMSGIHINLFCKNDAPEAKAELARLKKICDRPFGEIVFWWFVAPLLMEIRELLGAEYAFLFAADDSDDESLVKYYTQSMGFKPKNDIGANKPWWDWTCTFLCKDLSNLESERKRFVRIFNTEQQMFKYEKIGGGSK